METHTTTKTHGYVYTKLKKNKKTCGKVLTKGERGDIMYKLSAGKPEASRKRVKKFFEKTFKKVLTRARICDILVELSSEEDSDWTLKIKQRDKKRNPRFRW